jgi:hypothetical protein
MQAFLFGAQCSPYICCPKPGRGGALAAPTVFYQNQFGFLVVGGCPPNFGAQCAPYSTGWKPALPTENRKQKTALNADSAFQDFYLEIIGM